MRKHRPFKGQRANFLGIAEFEAFAPLCWPCHTIGMIEQKFVNTAKLIGYAVGAVIVAAVRYSGCWYVNVPKRPRDQNNL